MCRTCTMKTFKLSWEKVDVNKEKYILCFHKERCNMRRNSQKFPFFRTFTCIQVPLELDKIISYAYGITNNQEQKWKF